MHLLPCPSCHAEIAVSPSQAGDQTKCPVCQASVDIPTLGKLRQLPQADQSSPAPTFPATRGLPNSSARRAGFVLFGLVATASLLVAGFCAIRWSLIDVPATSEEHIQMYREQYDELSAAELIRHYEDMEKYGLDLTTPYPYKKFEQTKRKWGKNASIAAGVGGLAALAACLLALTGRDNSSQPKLGPAER